MNDYNSLKEKYHYLFTTQENEPFALFGFECGIGWYDLLANTLMLLSSEYKNAKSNLEYGYSVIQRENKDTLYYTPERIKQLEDNLENAKSNLPVICQIKSKFATLRLYADNCTPYANGVIAMAESMSVHICETCGDAGSIKGKGWVYTLCNRCNDDRVNWRSMSYQI